MFFSLLSAPYPPVQFAQTNVAVGHERTHAELYSEGQSSTIMLLGLVNLRDSDLRANFSQKPQRPRLLSSLHGLLRAIKGALHNCNSVIKAASLKIRFA